MSTSPSSSAPSALLVGAALAGLLGVTAACDPSSGSDTTDQSTEAVGCEAGVSANPAVTSTTMRVMTEAEFRTACDSLGGLVEIQPHCGGANQCRGMSYDSLTQTLTEHTCRATNTCAGYSCIVCD